MLKKTLASTALLVALSGCAGGLTPVSTGLITNVKGPISATSQPTGLKNGHACSTSVLGLINKGDASIATAKRSADINTVSSVDYSTNGFYPFFGKTCVHVNGR
ncbi:MULTISPECIES: TRL-like family protein [unclassified Saccharibacter]|uniref:TRL-like family protein n=1 Tax=unclassified Saccharibacter TaxID=2648722 RepID=UPI001324589F|nr:MULTISPECIES: TRL-like family protein [unclassified Saccharibacter]MXV35166.1 hypothetical protein [Saccharibacter sp. EH611]MXV57287.1 hypothetical protein [Saccharibacter sp. EH70]MXV64852.1 hypothetical protein [Saccharibacter sp. EH60]